MKSSRVYAGKEKKALSPEDAPSPQPAAGTSQSKVILMQVLYLSKVYATLFFYYTFI